MPDDSSAEVEWQFDAVDLTVVENWLETQRAASPSVAGRHQATYTDTYLDTPDRRFERAGYSLRIRKPSGREKRGDATLKSLDAATSGPRVRREIAEQLETATIDGLLAAPGPVGSRARAVAGRSPLVVSFEVRTKRTTYDLKSNGGAAAEIALDESAIRKDGRQRVRLRRVEVEVRGGATSDIAGFVERLAAAGHLATAQLSKFEVGLVATGMGDLSDDLGPAEHAPDAPITNFALVTLRRHVGALLRAEPAARLGDDPEGVHRMRVAIRRTRAALRLFGPHLPAELVAKDDDLRWIARVLGDVRDLDVQIADLDDRRDASQAFAHLGTLLVERREEARATLLEALDGPRYTALVRRLGSVLRRRRGDRTAPIARAALPDIVEGAMRSVRRAGNRFGPKPDSDALHKLRKRGKRLRYALEFSTDVYGDRTEAMIERLTALQDALGDYQDAVVAIERLRSLASANNLPAETVFAMGGLAEERRRELARLVKRATVRYDAATKKAWKKLSKTLDKERPPPPDGDGSVTGTVA